MQGRGIYNSLYHLLNFSTNLQNYNKKIKSIKIQNKSPSQRKTLVCYQHYQSPKTFTEIQGWVKINSEISEINFAT